MGCTTSSAALTEEEKAIVKGEKTIGWSQSQARVVISAFEHRAGKNNMSANQFKAALGEAELEYTWLDSPDDAKYLFFKQFKENEGKGRTFETRKVILLAILLTKGSAKDKSEYLFDLFDEDANLELSQKEITDCLTALFDIARDQLVDLGVGQPLGAEGTLEAPKVEAYKTKLERNKESAIKKTVVGIAGTSNKISKEGFAAKMATAEYKQLVTSAGIRMMVAGESAAVSDPSANPPADQQNQD